MLGQSCDPYEQGQPNRKDSEEYQNHRKHLNTPNSLTRMVAYSATMIATQMMVISQLQ